MRILELVHELEHIDADGAGEVVVEINGVAHVITDVIGSSQGATIEVDLDEEERMMR
ncbi:MAG: hypothetical protein ACYS7Y_19130 [Planctomycetota bacterium]|jgi:hypothetical protein